MGTFQSPDGDFVYSDQCLARISFFRVVGFNPLTGISSILTGVIKYDVGGTGEGFNPLTGISSILTSRSGLGRPAVVACFNPLTGISSILT